MSRVREIITEYKSLPKNAGALAAIMMEQSIKNAENQIAMGDTIEMIKAYSELETYEL